MSTWKLKIRKNVSISKYQILQTVSDSKESSFCKFRGDKSGKKLHGRKLTSTWKLEIKNVKVFGVILVSFFFSFLTKLYQVKLLRNSNESLEAILYQMILYTNRSVFHRYTTDCRT